MLTRLTHCPRCRRRRTELWPVPILLGLLAAWIYLIYLKWNWFWAAGWWTKAGVVAALLAVSTIVETLFPPFRSRCICPTGGEAAEGQSSSTPSTP